MIQISLRVWSGSVTVQCSNHRTEDWIQTFNLATCSTWPCFEQGFGLMTSEGASQPQPFYSTAHNSYHEVISCTWTKVHR